MRPPTRRTAAALCCATMLVLSGAPALAYPGGPITRSATEPSWASRKPVCPKVDLTTKVTSGVSGVAGDGYNASLLLVVSREGVTCSAARTLARKAWITGKAAPLHWLRRRAWRYTEGSGYVGDFVGTAAGKRVEFYAIH